MKSPKFAISKNNSHQFEENKDRLKIGIENNKSKIQNNKDLNIIQKEEEANLKGKHITKSSRNISIRGKNNYIESGTSTSSVQRSTYQSKNRTKRKAKKI